MTSTGQSMAARRRDGLILGACLAAIVAGTLAGLPAAVAVAVIAAVPVAGFLLAGHVPGRGGAVGCIAMGLASTLIRPEAGAAPWGSLALIAGIGLAALVAGAQAEGMAAARGLTPARPAGRWVTIVVECDGPADAAGRTDRPRLSPHPAPERRALARLAGDRRRGRRPLTVHVS